MSPLLLPAILLGIATAATPPGILAEVTVLGAEQGIRKGVAVALGLGTSITLSGLAAHFLFGVFDITKVMNSRSGDIAGIVMGLAAIVLGIWVWRQPAQKVGGFAQKAFAGVDRLKLWVAFVVGMFTVNLVPAFVLVTGFARDNVPRGQALLVWAVYFVIATTCVWIPLLIRVTAGDAWEARSDAIRRVAVDRGNTVFGIVAVVAGVWFAAESLLTLLKR